MTQSISFIIPAYNEEQNIEQAVNLCFDFEKQTKYSVEVVVVDDGSNDNTLNKLNNLTKIHPNLKIFQHKKNLGIGRALKNGYLLAKNDYLVFLPADMQIIPEDIIPFLDVIKPDIIALHVYTKRGEKLNIDTIIRAILSKSMRFLLKIFGGINFEYSGTYIFHKDLISKKEIEDMKSESFVFNFEILSLLIKRSTAVKTFFMIPRERFSGESKVANPKKIAGVFWEIIKMGF